MDVREAAAQCLTDMLSVLGSTDATEDAPQPLRAALIKPSLELVSALWEHCEQVLDALAEAMSATAEAEAAAALEGEGEEPDTSADRHVAIVAEAAALERAASEKAMHAVALVVRLVTYNKAGPFGRMLGSNILAHTPLLGDSLFSIVLVFVRYAIYQ